VKLIGNSPTIKNTSPVSVTKNSKLSPITDPANILSKVMAYYINPDLSEDELIALLCGEFGGISSSILHDAMNITPSKDIKSDNVNDDGGEESMKPGPPANTCDALVFAGQINPCRCSTGIGKANESLFTAIDTVVIASQLESMNEDVGHEVDSKTHGGIDLPHRVSRNKQV
jgi:hypothetical protein